MDSTTIENLVSKIDTISNNIQSQAIRSVSRSLTLRNWIIGYYIVEYEQNGRDRAKYGNRIIENLAKRLKHIKGISPTNLRLYRTFYLEYPQIQQTVSVEFKTSFFPIQQTLSDKSLKVPVDKLLSRFTFSHFVELLRLDDSLKRVFYEVEAIKGNWSVRELNRQINSMTYERVGLSTNKKELIASINNNSQTLSPSQIIKDPYIIEFTGLEQKIKYSENDLETALLNHIQDFLLELGDGFCFEARQK